MKAQAFSLERSMSEGHVQVNKLRALNLGFRSLKMCVFRFSPFIVIDCSTINSA